MEKHRTQEVKIPKHCTPNFNDRCISCNGRRISERKKRICPLYASLKKKDPVEVYEMWVTSANELRARIDELSEVVQDLVKHFPKH